MKTPTLNLVLCAKFEATEFSDLSSEEFVEMGVAISDIERVLKAAFDYDKINYLMLMMVDPNVHFYVFPRYEKIRSACGFDMIDEGWPTAPTLTDSKKTIARRVHYTADAYHQFLVKMNANNIK